MAVKDSDLRELINATIQDMPPFDFDRWQADCEAWQRYWDRFPPPVRKPLSWTKKVKRVVRTIADRLNQARLGLLGRRQFEDDD
jgi:hypothetical protein